MILFEFVFSFCFIKSSLRNSFCYILRNRSYIKHKAALKYHQFLNKFTKYDLQIRLLYNCKRSVVNTTFIRRTNIPTKSKRYGRAFYVFFTEWWKERKIAEKERFWQRNIKFSRILRNSSTWMKMQLNKYSVNCYIYEQMAKVSQQQNKKLYALIFERSIKDSLQVIQMIWLAI